MPNCAFYNCFDSRQYKQVSWFQISIPRNSVSESTFHRKEDARISWIKAILRTRQLDTNLKKQRQNDNIHICEINFKEEYIENFPKRKTLKTRSFPKEKRPCQKFRSPQQMLRECVNKRTNSKACFSRNYGYICFSR